MPVPSGVATDLAAYLQELEDRLTVFERALEPLALYPMLSTSMNIENAAIYINRTVYCSDLNLLAYSNGSHWFRSDTGAQIV